MDKVQEILRNGFYREGYNGDDMEHCYLSYRFVDGKVVRVTITSNPWLIMGKQEAGERFVFVKVSREEAQYLANRDIIYFQTGQHLFGVLTTRQALRRLHPLKPSLKVKDLYQMVKDYNRIFGLNESILRYGRFDYISKKIVEDNIDFIECELWLEKNS